MSQDSSHTSGDHMTVSKLPKYNSYTNYYYICRCLDIVQAVVCMYINHINVHMLQLIFLNKQTFNLYISFAELKQLNPFD